VTPAARGRSLRLGGLGVGGLGVAGLGAAVALGAVAVRRVVVEGTSMVPTLVPGDRVLVVRLPRRWPLRPGDVVAVADPRRPDRLLVKRVASVTSRPERVVVAGDNALGSTDSRTFGPVARQSVWGRAWYRYAPAGRTGAIT
jgi:nickel-type superoxide dismutase maturation protease